MIDLCQWRYSIGLWYCNRIPFTAKKAPHGTSTGLIQGRVDLQWFGGSGGEVGGNLIFCLALFVLILLILSGDIELNPGPKAGDCNIKTSIIILNTSICRSNTKQCSTASFREWFCW